MSFLTEFLQISDRFLVTFETYNSLQYHKINTFFFFFCCFGAVCRHIKQEWCHGKKQEKPTQSKTHVWENLKWYCKLNVVQIETERCIENWGVFVKFRSSMNVREFPQGIPSIAMLSPCNAELSYAPKPVRVSRRIFSETPYSYGTSNTPVVKWVS